MARRIVTSFDMKPIPVRDYDWAASDDDRGEEGPTGYGATEAAAILDLIEQLGDKGDFEFVVAAQPQEPQA